MKICRRCGKEYSRDEKEIVVFPGVCRDCDIFLSNLRSD